MVDNTVKLLGSDVEKFDRRVNNINLQEDTYRNKQEIEDLERLYNTLSKKFEDCDSEIQDTSNLSSQRPLITKLSQYKGDLEIAKNKLNEKKNKWKNQYNIELLKEGKLTGADKIKTERQMILDQHKETDSQGNVIDSIASNIKDTNRNLEGVNTELKSQGEQMNRIQDKNTHIDSEVKQVNKIMSKIEGKAKCIQILTFCSVFFMGIADIGLIIALILIKFVFQNN